jgi:hypothetical protein
VVQSGSNRNEIERCQEDIWGSGSIAPLFFTTALDRNEWSASRPFLFTPRGTSPRCPLDRRLGGPQSWSGHCEEQKISEHKPHLLFPRLSRAWTYLKKREKTNKHKTRCDSFRNSASVGAEVLTAVTMKSTIFWDVTLCSPVRI